MLEEFEPVDPLPRKIESDRLLLRQVGLRDAEELARVHTAAYAAHLAPWSPQDKPHGSLREAIDHFEEFTLLALERWADDLDYRFCVILKETGSIVGLIGITNVIRGVSRSGFLGYWTAAGHLNQGIATESTILAFAYAFESLRLHRLNLWIAQDNLPSLRIARKLGLRYEGTVQKALYLGGKWKDTDSYAILREEWDMRKLELMGRVEGRG